MPRPNRSTPKIMRRAKELRREQTPAERKLCTYLSERKIKGVKFRRQHAIGNFIVDFCAVKEKLIIELDGSQHLDQSEYDEERTAYLEVQGYKVIRFWNNQVLKDVSGCVVAIEDALKESD